MILLMVSLATILILGITLNPQPHDEMRSLGWRAFGALNGIPSVVFGLAFMLPHRTHFAGPFDRVIGAMLLSSAVGIVGFAYGRRYGNQGAGSGLPSSTQVPRQKWSASRLHD